MNAIVIHGPHDLRFAELPQPSLVPDDVAVRIEIGGICGSDLHYYHDGGFGTVRLREPMILGHEVAGTILACGTGVTTLAPGDRVAVNPALPCGRCVPCLAGRTNHCEDMRFFGSAMRTPHVQGAFRDFLVCKARQCVVARHADAHVLALAEPLAVALHAVRQAGPLAGMRVLVTGCGPIGALVVVAARLAGARDIVATDIVPEPLAIVRRLGADHTIDTNANPDALASLAGAIDVLIECSGNRAAFATGLATLRPHGVLVQVGLGADLPLAASILASREITIRGSFRFCDEFERAVTWLDGDAIDLRPLVSDRFPARAAREAFERASDRRRAMKVQLVF